MWREGGRQRGEIGKKKARDKQADGTGQEVGSEAQCARWGRLEVGENEPIDDSVHVREEPHFHQQQKPGYRNPQIDRLLHCEVFHHHGDAEDDDQGEPNSEGDLNHLADETLSGALQIQGPLEPLHVQKRIRCHELKPNDLRPMHSGAP